MSSNSKYHKNYTEFGEPYQLVLPLNLEGLVPDDDSVRLLSHELEELDYSLLYQAYSAKGRNPAVDPKTMFKILTYAYSQNIYSSRKIETACKRDINFMWLLAGQKAPDHSTIARFRTGFLADACENLFYQMVRRLEESGELSKETVFIDGTKLEACANKYTFVWKKAVTKNQAKLFDKILVLVEECENLYGFRIAYNGKVSLHTLKRLRKKLCRIRQEEGIVFVHGTGRRKTHLQKSLETLETYIAKLKEYNKKLYVCGERNSYSKTDPDATFMRMKEDAMLNGQLKPAYNLQHGVDSEYITWLDISPRPTDTRTLIPFLKDMELYLPFKYQEIVADAGYESEENYLFLEENGQLAYIKPQNYEISKTRKYRQDIGRMENMKYDEKADCYYCKNGQMLTVQYEKREKTASGYRRTVTVYRSNGCSGCPFKTECIKGNNCKTPMEDRQKVLYVSKKMKEKRQETLERITSDYGTQLRMNRSIQAEGSFANIKEDMEFRRYLYRGNANVTAQSILLAIGYNINKLHHKIQAGRTGRHLFPLKQTA